MSKVSQQALHPPFLGIWLVVGRFAFLTWSLRTDVTEHVPPGGLVAVVDAAGAGSEFGPITEFGDVFGHGSAERDLGFAFFFEVFVSEFSVGEEGLVESADDDLFEFCSGKSVGDLGDLFGFEFARFALAAVEVDVEDFFALFEVRKIDEENFVEAAFAHEFRRELGDVVGGGHEEDRFGFVLHPGEEGGEDAGRGAAVVGARAAHSGEAFLEFVDPEDARGEGFGDADGAAHVFFALTDERAEDATDVHFEHRQVVGGGDGFGD